MTYYRRRGLEWWEEAAAAAAGVAAGIAAGYLARQWLRREPLGGEAGGDGDRERAPRERGERRIGAEGSGIRR